MRVSTNGFFKSGNHALVKACQLLGLVCSVHHEPFGVRWQYPRIFIKRDPRNIVLSMLRFKGLQVTPGMFISKFRSFNFLPENEQSLVQQLAAYEGWLTDPGTLVVSYEALIADDKEMRRIAEFVGTPYLDGAFEYLPKLTYTWAWPHSDYAELWTPEVDAVWRAEGGPELLQRWGY